LKNYANLDFLVPPPPLAPGVEGPAPRRKKGIVFIDSKLGADEIAEYLNAKFPEHERASRPVRHYHSSMSSYYKEETFASFKDPNGHVCIIIATETASNVRFKSSASPNPVLTLSRVLTPAM
jgi:superfamily II DNA/RNA helicase